MSYKFPPPVWFESGTTSHFLIVIALWFIVITLPSSILACETFGRRSRAVWIIAEVYWVLIAIVSLAFWIPLLPAKALFHVPVGLAISAYWLLILLPVPAALIGLDQLTRHDLTIHTVPQRVTIWICSMIVPFVLNGLWNSALIHPPEAAARSACRNNLKQVGLAMHTYLEQFQSFPDLRFRTKDSPPSSWRVELLPFLDHPSEYNAYSRQAAWNEPLNLPVGQASISEYLCPSVPVAHQRDAAGRRYTGYAALMGRDCAFPNGRGRRDKEFSDGLSTSVLVAEACGQQIVWTEPRDVHADERSMGVNLPGTRLGKSPAIWSSYHPGVANVLTADGAVHSLNEKTDPRILHAMTTVNAGDVVDDY